MKKTPTILFVSDIPASASIDDHFIILKDGERKPYREAVVTPRGEGLTYPGDYSDPDIPEGSVAYYPIFGAITSNSWWCFSTSRFMNDLQAAEENPSIVAHLLHIDSGGGEAFLLHEAFEQIKALSKPCYAVIDSIGGSAAYYLASAADKIFASSIFSLVGCIGIVSVFYDDAKMLEKWGLTEHEYYSNYSPLKNKVFNDAIKGEGEEYVKRFLDPMALTFIEDVKSVRKDVSEAALQGETYYTADAIANGLVDGENTLEEVLDLLLKTAQPKQQSPSVDINTLKLN